MNMRIAVLGYTQSGKTTVGHIIGKELAKRQPAQRERCWSIGDALVDKLSDIYDIHPNDAIKVKPALRHELWLIGRALEQEDPLLLIRECLKKTDVVCGMRTEDELISSVEAELFYQYLWVARPERNARPEDELTFDTLAHWAGDQIRLTRAQPRVEYINNDGTLEDLRRKAIKAAFGT